MKLLFDEVGTRASTEMKELLGFIDVDLKFSNLKPDVRTATGEVIDFVGREVYDIASAKYATGNLSAVDKELVYMLRYPIAINAYYLYAPSNDLRHTNNGRKMNQDDHQKVPFQWMLDSDNASLEKRYYRALDDLIKYLDTADNSNVNKAWKESDTYKTTHNLFVRTTAEFDRYFMIKSKYLLLKLAPGLEDCEQFEIKPRIGKTLFDELKTKLKANAVIDDVKRLELLRLIKKATVLYSMAWAMPRLSVNLYPEGVLQHVTSDKATTRGAKPSLKSETEAARQAFMSDANRVFLEIETLVAPEPTIEQSTFTLPKTIYGDKFLST